MTVDMFSLSHCRGCRDLWKHQERAIYLAAEGLLLSCARCWPRGNLEASELVLRSVQQWHQCNQECASADVMSTKSSTFFSSVPRTVSLPDDEEFERPREKSPILGICSFFPECVAKGSCFTLWGSGG